MVPNVAGQSVDVAVARIRVFLRASGLKKRVLASRVGLRDSTIRHIDRPDWNPTYDTLRKIESVIPEEFIIAADEPELLALRRQHHEAAE